MMILIPLALIGVGAFVYFLFNTASHALPLAVGVAAALASTHAGFSPATAFLIGIAVFMLITGLARFVVLTAPPNGRVVVVLALAIPAAFAGYLVGHGLAGFSGLPALLPAVAAAALTAVAAANRVARPAP